MMRRGAHRGPAFCVAIATGRDAAQIERGETCAPPIVAIILHSRTGIRTGLSQVCWFSEGRCLGDAGRLQKLRVRKKLMAGFGVCAAPVRVFGHTQRARWKGEGEEGLR